MKIQGINNTPYFYNITSFKKDSSRDENNKTIQPNAQYITPAINFGARVDKGLERFYEFNSHRMPQTVKTYIESLGDRSILSPLMAQRNAFARLADVTDANEIKTLFPKEDLFKNLINPEQSKATRGILGVYRENKELLDLCNQGILANNENLTVYLVKKIFLEGKTLDEMNEDLKKDANPEFLEIYNQKEESIKNKSAEGKILRSSTLKALGIEQPEVEYLQSLRYTRDGYSDLVGEKISQVQRAFWESMPVEERTARARKSVERFEKWWNSLTRDQQLDKIAAQADEIELLEEFNKSDFGKTKRSTAAKTNIKEHSPLHQKTSVTSTLSRDDLFKIWASNNLKIFTANLSDLDKRILQTKRTQNAAARWENMTPAEKTEYISKLKAGTEPLKYAMIDAWNNNPDIIVAMSIFLKKRQINKPLDELYSSMEFSNFMSKAMTEFWEEHPDFAIKLGSSIKDSHQKIKEAVISGHFQDLKNQIMNNKKDRIKNILAEIKNHREINLNLNGFRPIVKEFATEYQNRHSEFLKFLPDEYLQDFFNIANEELPDNQIKSWLKVIRDDDSLTVEDFDNINAIKKHESNDAKFMNRALEGALADTLYLCTGSPEVFMMSQADAKVALLQIAEGYDKVALYSEKYDRRFELPVRKHDFDRNMISKLYNWYKTPLNNYEINSILEQFFTIKTPDNTISNDRRDTILNLCEYIFSYGHSIFIPFSHINYPPEVKAAFVKKFLDNLPSDIPEDSFAIRTETVADFQKEEKIKAINHIVAKKYSFLPKEILELYTYELDKMLRAVEDRTVNDFKYVITEYQKENDIQFVKSIRFRRELFNRINTLYSLCAEQTIADIIYNATGEPKVYAMSFEELIDAAEQLSKKNNRGKTIDAACSILNGTVSLKLKNKLNFYKGDNAYNNYKNELIEYLKELEDEGKRKADKTELLYILNPEESQKEIDYYTQKRIDAMENYF